MRFYSLIPTVTSQKSGIRDPEVEVTWQNAKTQTSRRQTVKKHKRAAVKQLRQTLNKVKLLGHR
jgi:hypothetical protein